MIKGILHVHTIFSYDGKIEIEDLRERANQENISFIILAEHAETLLERKNVRKFLQETGNYNSPPFVIPGVEYTCSPRVHLLAIGIKGIMENYKDPIRVIENTQREDGLVIWGHYDFELRRGDMEILRKVDGVEIWNRKYDGKISFLPRKGKLFNMIRKRYNNNLKMYNGADLHSFSSWSSLFVTMPDISSPEEIMKNLRAGNFKIVNRYVCMPAEKFSPSFRQYVLMQFTGLVSFLIMKIRNMIYYLCRKFRIPISSGMREMFRKIP